jgi:hypothetical protein
MKEPRRMGDNQTQICEAPILIVPNWEKEFHVHMDIPTW